MKKISIITINCNNKGGLEKTMNSVSPQLNEKIEYVVVDGGSNDGSAELIKDHKSSLAAWVSEKDKGIFHAQNKGIGLSSGEYCLFLNSGDLLASPNVIEQMMPMLNGEDIVYGDIITRDKTNTDTLLTSPDNPDTEHFMVSTLWHPTAFIKRDLFSRLGAYNETFKITGDYEFFVRAILKHNASTKHVNLPIAIFDMSGISNSPEAESVQNQEREKSWELNFSPIVVKTLKEHTRLKRSGAYKIGKAIRRLLPPFRT